MKKIVIFLLIIASTIAVQADNKRKRLLNVITMEIKELSRLSKNERNRNPETLLRVAELYLEKGRIIREMENERFFTLSVKQRRNIDRNKFFAGSQAYMDRAQKTGVFILKRFKRFKARSEVYYILAFNEKERGNMARAKKLFVSAIKSSKTGSDSNKRARVSLADIYYADGDFQNAKRYYDSVIRGLTSDRWYTKYLYNLSWANFRLNKKNLAVKQMNQVFALSKQERYVDKKEVAQRDLGYFYADMGKVKKASRFYKKVGGNVAKNFYDMGMHLKDKQKYSQALSMFKNSYYTKDEKYRKKALVELLSLYDKYGNNELFVVAARDSLQHQFDSEEKKEVLFWITKRAAVLQKEMQQKFNINRPKILKRKGQIAAELYVIIQKHDGKLSEKSMFFAAESYFAAREYEKALEHYEKVKQLGNTSNKYYRLSIEGMLTALNKKGLKRSTRDKYFESTYVDYIKLENNSRKKEKAVEKLFSYLVDEKKNPKRAEVIFFQYAKAFPQSRSKNEAMIGRIVDTYKKGGSKNDLFAFVKKIKQTEIGLSRRFVNSLNRIILTTQFQDVQTANNKGAKVMALRGYLTIYKDPETTPAAKRNAAYNVAVLFYELGNITYMRKWIDRSLDLMEVEEVLKFSDSFSSMINEIYLRQDFKSGLALTDKIIRKTCRKKMASRSVLVNNYAVMGLAEGLVSDVESFYRTSSNCGITRNEKRAYVGNIIDYYLEVNNISKAKEYYGVFSSLRPSGVQRLNYLASIMSKGEEIGVSPSNADRSTLRSLYLKNKSNSKRSSDAIDEFAKLEMTSFYRLKRQVDGTKLKFPQNIYNSLLQKRIASLDKLTRQGINILKLGSGHAMVLVYTSLIDSYDKFVNEVGSFTPPGKSADYVKSFKAGMKSITNPLSVRVAQFRNELKTQVENNDVLDKRYAQEVSSGVIFAPEHDYVLMDKRGK